MKEIATEFNVNYNLIRNINYGESWKNDSYSYPLKNSDERCSICDSNSLNLIFWLLKNSTCSMEQIADYFDVGRKTIERINKGKTHYD